MKKRVSERFIATFTEILMIVLLVSYATIWDILLAPEWHGTPIPLILFAVVLLLVVFAPRRWA